MATPSMRSIERLIGGDLVPGEAKEAPNREAAKRRAEPLTPMHAGALAFSRTGDPDIDSVADIAVIAVFGAVDIGALES